MNSRFYILAFFSSPILIVVILILNVPVYVRQVFLFLGTPNHLISNHIPKHYLSIINDISETLAELHISYAQIFM